MDSEDVSIARRSHEIENKNVPRETGTQRRYLGNKTQPYSFSASQKYCQLK